ncbi:hypothetical protein [Maribacter polysaccharolyticus]|uniref:hypothetical protein n=1 Tax=Maribacter polysaccharolyticus TaxID=3020831 RepID=UPI00237F6284|nr:hypothetical protein [Maribacter polysaccharolyticus]MDE3744082.1 hypothetical protein [Maribacter polysaccharolyticus]
MALVGLSSLPYLHEAITYEGGLRSWVPVLGIEGFLTDGQGKVLGFSTYRMFLYTLLIFVFSELGWAVWLYVSKHKTYYLALFVPVLMGAYQILLLLLNLRKTTANSAETKLLLVMGLSLFFGFLFLRKNRFTIRIASKWLFILGACTLPFFHDIITFRDATLKSWVPVLGIEEIMTDSKGYVRGFGQYRSLVYFLMLHVYAHLGWLGAFIYYGIGIRKVRPFLLVPVIVSLYSVIIIILNWQETNLNTPNTKFYITIIVAILLAINYFFNHKKEKEAAVTKTLEET